MLWFITVLCLLLTGCGPHPSVPEERRIADEDHIAGIAFVTDRINISSMTDDNGIWHICSSDEPWKIRDYRWICFEEDPDDHPVNLLLTEYGTKKEIIQMIHLDPEDHFDHIDIWRVMITNDGEILAADSGKDLIPSQTEIKEEYTYHAAYTEKTPQYFRRPYGGERNPKTKYRHEVVIRISADYEDYDPELIFEEYDGNGNLITKNRIRKEDLSGSWTDSTEPDYRVSENCRKLVVQDGGKRKEITETASIEIRSKDESGLIFEKQITIDFRDEHWQ